MTDAKLAPRSDHSSAEDSAARYGRLWREGRFPELRQFLSDAGELSRADVADVVRVDQCQRWRAGERVPVEDYVREHLPGDGDAELVVDLAYQEYLLREELGEAPSGSEFGRRFPQVAEQLRQQIEFHRALDSAGKGAVNGQANGKSSDGAGAARVSEPTDLSDGDAGTDSSLEGKTARTGARIGPYKLLQRLGEGGMGEVWVVEQEQPVRRRVAMKIIKPGMDSAQVVARFEQERQALAMMDHPNIAKVLDAGTTKGGRPYFVMELIKGIPITRYCDQEHLTPKERLQLFVPICQAVQHAHQKGIIHRDLKPTNVLIALYDGQPSPKIIDFGVAKATSQRLTDRTMYTEVGTIVGTIEYMAPEQAELNNLDVDTRADIYSLGAMLYELLTGGPPFSSRELRSAAFTDMLRVIHDVDPPKPSTRVSTSADLPTIAAARKLEPRRLTKSLSGELDCIVLKCLEKDRARRYETANGLAADIQRFLANEPVTAQPASLRYRMSKLARRHKVAVIATTLVFLALVGGVIGATWGLVRAQRARRDSDEARGQLAGALDDARTNLSRAETAEGEATVALSKARNNLSRAETAEREARLRETEARKNLSRAEIAERQARLREAEALVGEAHGTRYSRREGQRFGTLAALKKAAEIGRELKQPPEWFDRLRNEAIAALALPDLHITRHWPVRPDSTYFLSVSGDFRSYARSGVHGISVRRMDDDTEIAQLPGGPESGHPFMSHDGVHFAQAFRHQKGLFTRFWRIETGAAPKELFEVKEIEWLAFMDRPEGRVAVCVFRSGAIGVYQAATGKRLTHFDAIELTNVVIMTPHPTEPLVALSSYHHQAVLIRDILTGKVLQRELPPWPGGSRCTWHPSGRYLCIGSSDSIEVRVYRFDPRLKTLNYWRSIPVSHGETRLSFNPLGDRFVATGWSDNVTLWDFWTGLMLFASKASKGRGLDTLVFRGDGSELALAEVPDQPERIGVWSVGDSRECREVVPVDRAAVRGGRPVDVHPGGRIAAQSFADGVRLFDLRTGIEVAHLSNHGSVSEARSGGVAFDAAGALYVSDYRGLFRWPIARDSKDKVSTDTAKWLIGPPTQVSAEASDQRPGVSQDGRVLAQSMYNGYGMTPGGWIYHPSAPKGRRVDSASNAFASVSPDGRYVAFSQAPHDTGPAKVFDAATGKRVWQSPKPGSWCRFSGDGRWLLTGRDPGQVYEVGTWKPGPSLGPGGLCDCTADGAIAVLDLGSGAYRFVEMATGRELARLEDPEQYSSCARFTPDGATLVTQSKDGLRVWDLRRIRHELTKMGLDWDAAPFPQETEPASGKLQLRPIEVEIIGADRFTDPK